MGVSLGRGLRGAAYALAVGVLLGACGQKGPLFIPTEEDLRKMEERERKLEERARRKRGETTPTQTAPATSTQTSP